MFDTLLPDFRPPLFRTHTHTHTLWCTLCQAHAAALDRAQQIADLQRELAAAQAQISRASEAAAAAAKEHAALLSDARDSLRVAEEKHALAQTEWVSERDSMARESAATSASLVAARTQVFRPHGQRDAFQSTKKKIFLQCFCCARNNTGQDNVFAHPPSIVFCIESIVSPDRRSRARVHRLKR